MNLKKILPYIVAIVLFTIASIVYFNPVLSGEKIQQSDITQFSGMAKEIVDYRNANNNEEPYWLGNAFSGMPAYQVSTYFPNDYISYVDKALRFLPRPADYTFLYFMSFFILLIALKVDWKLALLGSLSFGFSTYLIIIFGAGHNAKAHAIAYMPLVVAGFIFVFQRRYLLGFVLTSIAMALEVYTNHPQMTYYLGICLLVLGIVEAIEAVKNKEYKTLLKQVVVIVGAVMVGVGVNSTRLASMKEYAQYSTRGASELTFNPDGSPKVSTSGLDKAYITEYSYGKLETFNLFIPRFMGGGSREALGEDSAFYAALKPMYGSEAKAIIEQSPTYWGQQPIVEAPAYIGAIVFFLFFLGMFLVKGKLKFWLVGATVVSILLSWGKNLNFLTDLFIDYVPLYNKFRAVSSIQVIAELCVPLLAILALKEMFYSKITLEVKKNALKKASLYFLALIVIGVGYVLMFSDFVGAVDARIPENFARALQADRSSILIDDAIRTIFLVLITVAILYYYLKFKLKVIPAIFILGILILYDLISVDVKYVNKKDFTSPVNVKYPFKKSVIDAQISEDNSYYRVANMYKDRGNNEYINLSDGRTSYFHNSIGGYHAAKMRRYQELFDYQVNGLFKNSDIYNMLNTKYFMFSDSYRLNADNNGAVWFVDDIHVVRTADDEMKSLADIDTKETAVVRVRDNEFDMDIVEDSTATINIIRYSPNHLIYESSSKEKQFAVFSEIYYKDGWNAYIDGTLSPYYQTDYVLRGMEIPAGKHKIEFKFEPEVIKKGSTISYCFYILLVFIPCLWWFFKYKKNVN